jgi:flagellar protein FlgJ
MGFEDFKKIGKEPLVKNIIGGEVSPFEKKAQEKLAEDYVTVRESGRVARRALSDINRLESLLEKTETGFGASAKLAAGNLGIATKGLNELQAAEALINKLVPQQRPPGSGTMSDADLELYKKSVVRIINQPGANKIIIDSTKDINNYILKEADIANQVLNGKISREEADRKLAELGNPVQDFFKKNPSIIGGTPSTKGVRFLGFE